MKLQMKLGSALLGFSVLMAVPATAAYAQDKKVLIVATDTAFVPFEFKQNGKYTGFDIELWEALAKKNGCAIQTATHGFQRHYSWSANQKH